MNQIRNCPRLVDCLTDVTIREGSQQAIDLRQADVETKLRLLDRTIRTGIKRVELTAFAPGKWFADADILTEGASAIIPDDVLLRALYFNPQGLDALSRYARVFREGIFHTAVTPGYRQKNFHQSSIDDVRGRMDELLAAFASHALAFDTLVLSTAWGGPREKTTPGQVIDYLGILMAHAESRGYPIGSVTLADTVGRAYPEDVGDLIREVKAVWPELVIRVHLHPAVGTAQECIDAALDSGVDQWEAAWGGLGGSPFANRPGGNMDIRSLVKAYRKRGMEPGLNIEAIAETIELLKEETAREMVDIDM